MIDDINYIFEEILSDDEEVINVIEGTRRPKMIRERVNHLEFWDDREFLKRFRLSKASVEMFLRKINNQLEHPTNQNHALTPLTQLLISLRFFATGCTERVVGDFAGVSEPTVCRVIKRVSRAIAGLSQQYIKFPQTEEELEETKQHFKTIARFPRVIGAIDCTHIKIQSPGGENAERYRNRKGFFSINVQSVSNEKMKFINLVARWPGSVNDRTIFDNSRLKGEFEEGRYENSFLLGDSGYTLTRYVMIPLLQTHTRAEALYNESLIRTRNIVERKYGLWKRRFPILKYEIRLKLDTALVVIVATAILHNLAIDMNDDQPEGEPVVEEEVEENVEEIHFDGVRMRNILINEYFANL